MLPMVILYPSVRYVSEVIQIILFSEI